MNHKIHGRKLNRTSSHRKAMLKNIAVSLLLNEQVRTTVPKAKELRPFVEKLITKARDTSLSTKRYLESFLPDSRAVDKLLAVIGPRYIARPGGYTRIVRAGFRKGDSSPVAYIELLERDIAEKGRYTERNPKKQVLAKEE